ncbi:hypothetical protein BJX99DRAFT_232832 [Aspergillus californicus]
MPNYQSLLLSVVLGGAVSATASASPSSHLARNENVLVFDAPAYETSTCPVQYLSTVQAYTYTKGSVNDVVNTFKGFLNSSGVEVDNEALETLRSRSKYFATTPIGGKVVEISVDGCASELFIGKTAVPTNVTDDAGMAEDSASLGSCGRGDALTGRAVLGVGSGNQSPVNTIYKSGKKGWGVISDIDDTIKITGDGLEAIKATLIDEATPVSGMPDLYAALTDLINPSWIYLTGSPWQLYGMLHEFIGTQFATSQGPILMKNLTYTGVEGLLEFLAEGTSLEYKAGRIDDIHSWYPGKQYLGIGDSSASDPEAYAYAYHQYGAEWMKCIWIHTVDGGNNTAARWEEAFKGIPESVYKLYSDPEELSPEALLNGRCF